MTETPTESGRTNFSILFHTFVLNGRHDKNVFVNISIFIIWYCIQWDHYFKRLPMHSLQTSHVFNQTASHSNPHLHLTLSETQFRTDLRIKRHSARQLLLSSVSRGESIKKWMAFCCRPNDLHPQQGSQPANQPVSQDRYVGSQPETS